MFSINDLISPMNGLVAGLLRSPLHFVASKGLMLVSWKGRRSGQTFSIPVGYQQDGSTLVVMLSKREEKTWWKNFRSPWPAELQVRGERRQATGELVPIGSDDFFGYCADTLERLPWMGSQFGGIRYDAARGLDEDQRALLAVNVGVVRFELNEASGPDATN